MESINVKAKRWGNSLGIVLPKSIVEKENIDEGTDLVINVKTKKRATGEDIINLAKSIRIAEKLKGVDTKKALREVDKAFWSE